MVETKNPSTRSVALFPGAFRPPHAAHFSTVRQLVERPDIDEVVVIVANRRRSIPGTTKVLDTDVARDIWAIYLDAMPKVRVEFARGSAVQHAFDYFQHAPATDRLLFCLGEEDFAEGDSRFDTVKQLAADLQREASVIAVPPGEVVMRATTVRAALASGEGGRSIFMGAMPGHLDDSQCERVWRICLDGMRDAEDIARENVRDLMLDAGFDLAMQPESVNPGKTDPVFRIVLADGRRVYVKFAGDTVKAASLSEPGSLKPRKRLSVERRAIKWLSTHYSAMLRLPEIIHFNKSAKLLVLGEVCSGGEMLDRQLSRGVFDPEILNATCDFLARIHVEALTPPPLWSGQSGDILHWQTLLNLRTTGMANRLPGMVPPEQLRALEDLSNASARVGYCHLDLQPKNVVCSPTGIGVIDLELGGNFGDPAFDLGQFLGHYLAYAMDATDSGPCQTALRAAVTRYQQARGTEWIGLAPRVIAFAGTALLYRALESPCNARHQRLLRAGLRLLDQGLAGSTSVEDHLCTALEV